MLYKHHQLSTQARPICANITSSHHTINDTHSTYTKTTHITYANTFAFITRCLSIIMHFISIFVMSIASILRHDARIILIASLLRIARTASTSYIAHIMRHIICVLFCVLPFCHMSYAAVGERLQWSSGLTLLGFFEQNLIPIRLYYNLSPQDKELTAEVKAHATYYTLRDDAGNLLHALIPISDSVQIHIYKDKADYKLDFIPIIAFMKRQTLTISLQHSPYQDIMNATQDKLLAAEFANLYRKSVASKSMYVGDRLVIVFDRAYRLGAPFGIPSIKAGMIETDKKKNFVFLHTNGHYYDDSAKEMAGFTLEAPVHYTRISSRFSHGRRHPILKIIRPHYGVDYVARAGTPIRAAASGRVVFAGIRGGYGRVVEIAHEGGLKTLYAHMQSIATRKGAYVRVGTVIGRVGNSGLSTGAHLHFGVYRFNQPINPLGRIRTAKSILQGKEKAAFFTQVQAYKSDIDTALQASDFSAHMFYLFSKE